MGYMSSLEEAMFVMSQIPSQRGWVDITVTGALKGPLSMVRHTRVGPQDEASQ